MSSSGATAGLVIIGGGMAAGRLLERLAHSRRGPIRVVCGEGVPVYNRVLLPGLVGGDYDEAALYVHDHSWYAAADIELVHAAAVAVDLERRCVALADGARLRYRQLVFATGSRPALPDIAGIELPGVGALRSLADAQRLAALERGSPVVVVGGGLLGLEAGDALARLGMSVSVVHRHDRLMNRQLDAGGAAALQESLERRGLRFVLGARPVALRGVCRVETVELDDGTQLPAAAVVFATGTVPNDALAARSGIRCDGGIVVDTKLRTSVAGVSALGECAVVDGRHHALVEPVYEQADVLANVLTGHDDRFVAPPPVTRLKVPGLNVFAAGCPTSPGHDDIVIRDPRRGVYRRLLFSSQVLTGAVLIGDVAGSRALADAIGSRVAESAAREALAFGIQRAA